MGYYLGVDLGTTFTAAAVQRGNRAETVSLDQLAMVMPSIVFARSDGILITGSTADRRGRSEPDRVAREFKRRLGDSTPIILGGTPFPAEALMAALLKSVVHHVAEVEGEAPAATCVTCPANWGAYRRELFTQVLLLAGIPQALVLTEPEAAATHYASSRPLPADAKIAVYDLGGGTFDATVLRRDEQGIEVLGTPQGLEHLGGMDFDEAIFSHVRRQLGGLLDQLDPENTDDRGDVWRLRQECVQAKEALSSETAVSIPVAVRGTRTEVRLTRDELESMLRAPLQSTVESLQRALTAAGVKPAELAAVLLVGGCSRIPLAGQLVSAVLGCPTALDAHPKHVTALGAARAAAETTQPPTSIRTVETIAPIEATSAGSNARPSRPPPPLNTTGGLPAYRKIAFIAVAAALSLIAIWGTAHALTGSGNHRPGQVAVAHASPTHSIPSRTVQTVPGGAIQTVPGGAVQTVPNGIVQTPVTSAPPPPSTSTRQPTPTSNSTSRASTPQPRPSDSPDATPTPSAAMITLTPTALPDPGCPPYDQMITATGGTAPYSFSISSGTLPPGLTLTTTGEIIGTARNDAGTYQFTVSATDSSVTPNSRSQFYTLNAYCIT
jgi:actin-like ATPase involved in cell morphogenesis